MTETSPIARPALPRRAARVVFRLRAAFVTALSLLLLGLALGAFQLGRLERSQGAVVERSVPTLVRSHELEGQLSAFLRLDERLLAATSRESVIGLQLSVGALVRAMRDTLRELPAEAGVAPALEPIERDLATLDALVDELAPVKRHAVGVERALAGRRAELERLGIAFRDLVEPQLVDVALALETRLERDAGVGLAAGKDGAILALAERQNLLTEISFRVASVVGTADQLSRYVGTDPSGVAAAHLTFELRSIARTLVALESDATRVALARLTGELRELVVGDDGIVPSRRDHALALERLGSIQATRSNVVARISGGVRAIVEGARADIARASVAFDRVLLETVLLFLAIGLSVLGVFALTSWLVVERQINRRMSRLTTAILELAAGRTDEAADIDGDDEIAAMGRALETFRENARELLLSNRELEQFAYAAAHDMRTPLRAIEHLAEWTLEDNDALPEDCAGNLHRILQRARRLGTLQNDLLDYSRAGHVRATLETVDMPTLVADQAELVDPHGRFPVTLDGDLRPMATYAVPLRQVLINLMGNAMKHHDRDGGTLRISVRQDAGRMTISVADDGPGIAPEYQGRIFELFKTLQSQDTVEGSGLGLSLVRKLIERYGGRIDVVSAPATARGTTFVFDWPRAEARPPLEAAA